MLPHLDMVLRAFTEARVPDLAGSIRCRWIALLR